MDNNKFVHKVVREALFNVRKCIEDGDDVFESIGIIYTKRTWKKIMLNLDEFRDYALTKNLDVVVSNDGSRHIYYKLLKKEIWQ